MFENAIRTITMEDYINFQMSEYQMLVSRCNRQDALKALTKFVEQYSREIEEEKKKINPDMAYIQRRVNKIAEMRGTLSRAQRVR